MSVEFQGNYIATMFDNRKRYRLHFQKGVPLSSNELDEVQDVSDSYIKQLISANFPRASSINDGFQVVESTSSTDRNFTIKGGDGTVNGAGLLFVDGYILFLKSDIEYEDQGNSGALTDDDFTETFPAAPALTTPLATRIDTVYVDFYFAEVSADTGSEYEDSTLIVSDIGFATANRVRMVQDIRVAEGYCSTAAQGAYLSGTILIDGDFGSGSTIHVDGFDNASGTVYEGTQFTIENDTTVYTVTSDATISGNECDLSITPSLVVSADDGEEVTFRIFEVGYPDGNDSNSIYHWYIRIATIVRDTSNDILTSMITENRVLINSIESYSQGTTITDLIMSDGQDIGNDTHRVGSIYMASTIDYSNDLALVSTSEHFRFTTTGRLGIGTTNPQSALHVEGDLTLSGGSTIFNSELTVNDLVQINQDDDGQAALEINQTSGTNTATVVEIANAGTGHALTIDSGSVGIGTTDPGYTLHVVGDCMISNDLTVNGTTTIINTEVTTADVLQIDQDDDQAALIVNQTNAGATATVVEINNAGSGHALVTDSGNVGFGTASPLNTLHVQGTSRVTGNTYLLSSVGIGTTNPLTDLHVQGSEIVTGTVGIGTATALDTLHVQGTSRVTGNAFLLSTVGIGTTNPLNTLHVQGTARVTGNSYLLSSVGIGTETALNTLHVQGTSRVTGDTFLLSNVGINTATALNTLHVQGTSRITGDTYLLSSVGIGTTNPQTDLHVQGSEIVTGTVGIGTATALSTLHVQGSEIVTGTVGIGTATALNTLHVQGTSRVTGDTFLLSNVGISTATALNTLHVQGTSRVTGNTLLLSSVGIGTANPLLDLHVQGDSYFTGNVGIGTTSNLYLSTLHVEGPIYVNGLGMINSSVGIGTTDPLEALHVQGNAILLSSVGIGTTNPLNTLHVQGTSRVTGDVSMLGAVGLNTAAPTTGDVYMAGWVRHSGGVLSLGGADLSMNGILAVLSDSSNVSAGFYRQTNSTDTTIIEGFSNYGGTKVRAFAAKSDRFYIAGNVGVGSTVPSQSIDTSGDITLDSQILFKNNGSEISMFTATGGYPGRFTLLEGTAGLGVIHLCHNALSMGYPSTTYGGYISIYGTNVVSGQYGDVRIYAGQGGSGDGEIILDSHNDVTIDAHASDFNITSANFDLDNTLADFSTNLHVLNKVGIGTTVGADQLRVESDGSVGAIDAYRKSAIGGDIIRLRSDSGGAGSTVAKIDYTGQIYSDAGTTITSPADFAEWTKVEGELEDYSLGSIVQQSEETDLLVKLAINPESVYGVITDRATFCGSLTGCSTNSKMKDDFKKLSMIELEEKYNAKRIAMTGHVTCKVIGIVKRGQKLTLSEVKGVAKAAVTIEEKINAFAIARQNYDSNEIGLIEIKL